MDLQRFSTDAVPRLRLGLRANWRQFALLVVINAFVGGMVGLERTVVPLLAGQEFGLASRTVALSFIVAFGVVKAGSNLLAGGLSDRIGRKRLLVAGWIFGLPVPFLIIFAPAWSWVVLANILLGINQGLAWSSTVIMKIDLAGPKQRGLAMGLNEFAGYVAVSLSALISGYLATSYGLRPAPFYLGIAFALVGLLLSIFFVHETHSYAQAEAGGSAGNKISFARVLLLTSWKDRSLFAASQAGLTNNLNDGMVWGLLPIFLSEAGLGVSQIGVVAAIYPGVWGVSQLATGALSDRLGRKWLIVSGLCLQAVGIAYLVFASRFSGWASAAVLMGLGTAMVYPALLAAVGDLAHPEWRATAVGVYRLWRDGGYALGALFSGLLADALGLHAAILAVAALTALSGLLTAAVMRETRSSPARSQSPVEQIQ